MLQILGVAIVTITIAVFGYSFYKKSQVSPMALEDQIQTLSGLGLNLNEGVTVNDLLDSFDREEYESRPFDMVLFMYGSEVESEPWGRNICDRVWNFDVEAIYGDGSYISIVKRFSLVAGMEGNISDVKDSVNIDSGEAWVSYKLNGEQRKYDIKIDNDWADPNAVALIMNDFKKTGMSFYSKDNGQASVWFYLDDVTAKKLNELSRNELKPTK